jgi:hypothetical protein
MPDVHELRRLAELNSKKTKRIYNPDIEDFTVNFQNKPYTVKALDMEKFPFHIANHIKKHLAKHLLFKRGIGKEAAEDLIKQINKEIEVTL